MRLPGNQEDDPLVGIIQTPINTIIRLIDMIVVIGCTLTEVMFTTVINHEEQRL